jgi:PleD family two-component response regulator
VLLALLDTDKDSVLGSAEINGAPAALKALDKNNDGQVSAAEIRPLPGHGQELSGHRQARNLPAHPGLQTRAEGHRALGEKPGMSNDTENSLAGLSVLVVDDEVMLRRRLSAHLEALGADVTGAGTLSSAQRLLADMEFDFVLLDIHLPDGLGTDLLRAGLAQKGSGVVVMTAEGEIKGAVEAMRLGALDYLVKPLTLPLPLVMRRARQARQSSRLAEHVLKAETETGFFFRHRWGRCAKCWRKSGRDRRRTRLRPC